MSDSIDIRPAQSITELDIHLGYLRGDVRRLVEAMQHMATKEDIQAIQSKMAGLASKVELADLEKRLQAGSVTSTFDRWVSVITRIGAAVAVIAAAAGGIAAFIHFIDRVPK